MRLTGDENVLVRGYAVTHSAGTGTLPQAERWDQLVYAARGVLRLSTDGGLWVLPPHRALWVPEGTRYQVAMSGPVTLRTLYFARGLSPYGQGCRVLDVPPLLRELIHYAHRMVPLFEREPAHERLVGVLLDVLRPLPDAPLLLPMPVDPRAASVAHTLRACPADRGSVGALAGAAGTSRRTLERIFLAETGMSVGRWRQRLRLVEAVRLLAEGMPVTSVAARVGYATPSAFGAAFTKELGVSPGRYFS
jgi:AraC-like DNA-binding protein